MRLCALLNVRRVFWGSLAFLICCSGVMLGDNLLLPRSAQAQDEVVDDGGEELALDEELDVGPVDEGAGPVANGPVAPDAGNAAAAPAVATGDQPSYLDIALEALGWQYGLIFLGLSFTLVALLVMNILTARRDNVCPTILIDEFEQHLDQKQWQEAYDLAKADDSFLGQVLSAGLAKISSGYPQAIEAMQEVGEEENMKLEHRLSYMALIGTISPMVGLFGTVQGMIASFQVIATRTGTPPPSELAKGISTALFTTLVGLGIAIPAIAAYNILKNRIARLVLEVGIVSEGLMARFQKPDVRKK